MIDIFEIGTIKRLPLETSYTNVVAIGHALLLRCPAGTELVIDGTGVGKPVADIFKWHGVTPWCVTATAGIEQTIDTAARTANVPKLLLISRIQSLLFEGRLKVHDRRPCCMDQPVDALIPCPRGLMRCGRSSGVPAPTYGSGRRQQLPLRPLDARWFASAAHDR